MTDDGSQYPSQASTTAADVGDTTTDQRSSRVTFLGGTSRSRSSVGVAGFEHDIVERESIDGEEPPPAGCPCTSGF